MLIIIGLLIGIFLGGGVGIAITGTLCNNVIKEEERRIDRLNQYYDLLNNWLLLKQSKINLTKYFEKRGYNKVAIYGLGELGLHLIDELSDTKTEVVCGIDKNISERRFEFETFNANDIKKINIEIDIVVVSAISYFQEICNLLQDDLTCEIVSLEEVIKQVEDDV